MTFSLRRTPDEPAPFDAITLSTPTYDPIICPGCDRNTEVQWLCWCHSPVCWSCHDDGAHHWREVEKREDVA